MIAPAHEFHDYEGNLTCFCREPAALKVIDASGRDMFGVPQPVSMWLCGFHLAQHHWEGDQRAAYNAPSSPRSAQ